jgi:hypothetical protein
MSSGKLADIGRISWSICPGGQVVGSGFDHRYSPTELHEARIDTGDKKQLPVYPSSLWSVFSTGGFYLRINIVQIDLAAEGSPMIDL